jgi:hypothetical protein
LMPKEQACAVIDRIVGSREYIYTSVVTTEQEPTEQSTPGDASTAATTITTGSEPTLPIVQTPPTTVSSDKVTKQ